MLLPSSPGQAAAAAAAAAALHRRTRHHLHCYVKGVRMSP